MIGDIIDFLKTAKGCVDIIIKELEELKDLESHGMKKIDLFIEIIKELGSSVVNLEKAYIDFIPLEHKLKYLIIKELKFDLEDFSDSLKEYKQWYLAVKNINQSIDISSCKCSCSFKSSFKKFWFCCGQNTDISNVYEPSNIIDSVSQLVNIPPSTMNKQLDESFHKIMVKLMVVIELEKDIFGTAINITHPVLRRAWMSLGPADKSENEIEQHKMEEALLAMLKDENGGVVVNENKCRELISDFLEGLEKKAGNKPNGRISIEELNECTFIVTNSEDNTSKSVLKMLGLETQPGCDLDDDDQNFLEKESNDNYSNISPDQILLLLAKHVSNHLKTNKSEELVNPVKEPVNPVKEPVNPIKEPVNPVKEPVNPVVLVSPGKKQNNIINIPCSFVNQVYVNTSDNSGLLECEGYGSNWPYKIAFDFIIPELDQKTFEHIEIKMSCTDQGWGGTGHCNLRYQIGINKILPAFFIDREKNSLSSYTYLIKQDEIIPGSKVTFWLCSAPWSGWSATLKSVSIEAKVLN